jgi:hypothetical protein
MSLRPAARLTSRGLTHEAEQLILRTIDAALADYTEGEFALRLEVEGVTYNLQSPQAANAFYRRLTGRNAPAASALNARDKQVRYARPVWRARPSTGQQLNTAEAIADWATKTYGSRRKAHALLTEQWARQPEESDAPHILESAIELLEQRMTLKAESRAQMYAQRQQAEAEHRQAQGWTTYRIWRNGQGWQRLEGRPVTFAGFEQFEFFLHRCPTMGRDSFAVSEVSSGAPLATGRTEHSAMQHAAAMLRKCKPASLHAQIEQLIAKRPKPAKARARAVARGGAG